MPTLTFWYEFGSTYSYLSASRIEAIAKEKNVSLIWQPFLLGPLFKQFGWETSPFKIYVQKGDYMWRDMERLCISHGLPALTRPEIFPQHSLMAARIAMIGKKDNWVGKFTQMVYTQQFAKGQNIGEEETLIGILIEMGLKAESILEQAKSDPEIKNALRKATETAQKLGLFGAPTFVTEDGEIFWGNDRLETAIKWALENTS